MKKVFGILLVFFSICGNLYGQNIHDEYEAGRRIVNEIVEECNLHETLVGHAYCGYFIGPSLFIIIKKGDSSYEVFQGERGRGVLTTRSFELTDKRLISLFSWTEQDKAIVYDIQNPKYIAIYYYFVLFDESHNVKLEFNISTMSLYKKVQKSRKLRKTLPFTKDQQELIWELSGLF